MDFWRTVEVLDKRKWLILLSIVAAVALTYGATRLTGSKWVATVAFVSPDKITGVKPAVAAPDTEGNAAPTPTGNMAQAAVFDGIVKSRDVVEPVLRKLGYTEVPPNFFENVTFISTGPDLYNLNVTDPNEHRSQDIANDMAAQFVTVYQKLRTSQAQDTVDRLNQQLIDTTAKLQSATTAYDKYLEDHKIAGTIDANLEKAIDQSSVLEAKRDDAAADNEKANAVLAAIQKQLAATQALPAPQIAMTSPLLDQERNELEMANAELDALRATRTDQHPDVVAATAKRDAIQARINADSKTISATPVSNPQLVSLRADEAQAQTAVASTKATLDVVNAQLAVAKSSLANFTGSNSGAFQEALAVKELTDMRTNLDERLNAARLAYDDAMRQNPITVMNWVNAFNPPLNTTKGRTFKLMLIAALAALIMSTGIIIGLDRVDRRVKNMREAEISLPTRMLAAIPQPTAALAYSGLARITETHPMSLYSESYRFLGLHILNERPDCQSIMTLSAKAEQGSTTTITNLGITLAQAGKRVIIVDANMRTAELHQVFGVENEFGFTDLLQTPTAASLDHALHDTTVAGLKYITSGSVPDNPWMLFRSGSLQAVSQQLKQMADYILYDTPSSLMFTDALNLAPVVDGAILCVRAFQPLTGAEQRIIDLLERSNVPVLGSVLNDVPTAMLEAFANYQDYYENTPGSNRGTLASSSVVVTRPELPSPTEVGAPNTGFTRN